MSPLIRLWHGLSATIRDTVLYGASLAWAKALSMLMLPVLTAMLVPADFARLELLSSAAEIGALFAGAGLVDTAYRFASPSDAPGRRAAAEILGLGVVFAAIGITAAILFAPHLAPLMPLAPSGMQMSLLGIAVAMEASIAVPLAWMRMRGQAGHYAIATALRVTVQTGLVVAFVALGWGVTGVLTAGAVAAVATGVCLVARQARETRVAVAPKTWGRFLGYGMPLVGGGLASFVLGTADRWLLAGAVSPDALGHYALAAKIAMIAALLTQPFELWWYPRRIALLTAPDGLTRSAGAVTTGAALTILSAAAAAVAGPLLVRLLTPAAYHPAALYIPWLAACLALQSLGSLVNAGSYARQTGTLPMAINGAAAVVALAGYLLLIPGHGVAGAIAATLLAQGARFILFLTISQRLVRLPLSLRPLLLPLAASAAAAGLAPFSGNGVLGIAAPLLLLATAAASAAATGALPVPFAWRCKGGLARAWI